MPTSIDQVYILMAFVAPGFIFHSTVSYFYPNKTDRSDLDLMKFLTVSAFNFAILSPAIYWLSTSVAKQISVYFILAGWFCVLFVFPILLGCVWGYLQHKELIHKFFRLTKAPIKHHVPTAWDWKFLNLEYGAWVLVHLSDGTEIAGKYHTNSFSSSVSSERDIFLEKVFNIENDGPWTPVDNSDGILIPAGMIKYIEFRSF